jgi:hypothetical protein
LTYVGIAVKPILIARQISKIETRREAAEMIHWVWIFGLTPRHNLDDLTVLAGPNDICESGPMLRYDQIRSTEQGYLECEAYIF